MKWYKQSKSNTYKPRHGSYLCMHTVQHKAKAKTNALLTVSPQYTCSTLTNGMSPNIIARVHTVILSIHPLM
jgi:hypothetical protein